MRKLQWSQWMALVCLWPSLAMADEGGSTAQNLVGMVPFALMFGVIYFLMLRPAQKQRQEQEDMLGALRRDDEVVTQSGLIGRLVQVDDKVVTIELGDRVRVRMLRERIAGLWDAKSNQRSNAPVQSRAAS